MPVVRININTKIWHIFEQKLKDIHVHMYIYIRMVFNYQEKVVRCVEGVG